MANNNSLCTTSLLFSPPPTSQPTSIPRVEQQPWGPSSFSSSIFGTSLYSNAGQLDIRRPGWSWPNSLYLSRNGNGAPFCYTNTCYTGETAAACSETNGQSISDHYCLWPAAATKQQEYTVLGPTCWSGTCYTSETQDICNKLGGTGIERVAGAFLQTRIVRRLSDQPVGATLAIPVILYLCAMHLVVTRLENDGVSCLATLAATTIVKRLQSLVQPVGVTRALPVKRPLFVPN
jgi:hypothetical protein